MRRTERTRRASGLTFLAHVVLLAAVLAGLGALVGHNSSFIADEGATMVEGRMLASGQGWLEHPPLLHALDPTGAWYPLENSDRSGDGFAPFAKHPAYALVAAAGYRVAGPGGVIALSVLGTLMAAVFAARIAAYVDGLLTIPCLWATGLLTPLLFDAYLAVGSTLGAALAGAAVLAVLPVWSNRSSARHALLPAVVAGATIYGATLLRTEGAIFGAALALVGAVSAVAWRKTGPLLISGAVLVGAVGGRATEAAMRRAVLGAGASAAGSVGVQGGSGGRSYLAGRLQAFYATWIEPSHPSLPRGDQALIVAWVCFAVLALLVRRRRPDPGFVTIIGVLLVGATVVRLVVDRADPIPGLLMGFPIGWVGVLLLRRRDASRISALCLGTALCFCGAVGATQYTYGEWMSRFFMMAIPISLPFLMVAVARALDELDAPVRRMALATSLVAASVVASVSVIGLRNVHVDNSRLVSAIRDSQRASDRQIVVTLVPWGALQAWPTYAGQQWLHVSISDLPVVSARLRTLGVRSFTLATAGGQDYSAQLRDWRVVTERRLDANGRPWRISVLE